MAGELRGEGSLVEWRPWVDPRLPSGILQGRGPGINTPTSFLFHLPVRIQPEARRQESLQFTLLGYLVGEVEAGERTWGSRGLLEGIPRRVRWPG